MALVSQSWWTGFNWQTAMFSQREKRLFIIGASLCRWRGSQPHSSAWGHDGAICRPSMQHWLHSSGRKTGSTHTWPQKCTWEHQERQIEKASVLRCKAKRCFYLTLTRVFQICRSLTVTQEEARVIKSSTGTSYRHFSFTTALSRSESAAFHTLFLQPTKNNQAVNSSRSQNSDERGRKSVEYQTHLRLC